MGEKARLLREAPLEAATLGIDGGRWRFVAFVAGGAWPDWPAPSPRR